MQNYRKKFLKWFRGIKKRFARRGIRRRFAVINRLYMLANRMLIPETTVAQGHKMYLDPQDSLNLLTNGIYEPFQTSLVKQNLKPGDIAVDIGANIGYYTLIFANLVGRSGKVVAFEPEPDLMRILEKNVEANGYRNVALVQKAVVDRKEVAALHLDEYSHVDHRMYDAHAVGKVINIETISLDQYFFHGDGKVNFIKMDIQGAEGKALIGMQGLLDTNPRVILMTEFWPKRLRNSGTDPKDFIHNLLNLGFVLNVIDERRQILEPCESLGSLIRTYSISEDSQTNLFCVKG